jgi:hypothetical protein
MKSKFLILILSILIFVPACSFMDTVKVSDMNSSFLLGSFDKLKVLQYYMIRDFESFEELALQKKDPTQVYGVFVSENYNAFLEQADNLVSVFSNLNVSEEEKYISDNFYNVYKPVLDDYCKYVSEVFGRLTTETLSKKEYDALMNDFDLKSEVFFYQHVDMVDLLLQRNWGIAIFKANE